MSLVNKKPAANPPRVNPEIDAKLNTFIGENKDYYDALMKQEKTHLVRKLMLHKMNTVERQMKQTTQLREVINADPALKQQVDRALERIPVERRTAAFKGIAQAALARQAVRAASPRVGA